MSKAPRRGNGAGSETCGRKVSRGAAGQVTSATPDFPIPAGIVSVEEATRAEEAPCPEAPPAGPAILTVVEPGRGEEGRKTPEEAK